MSAATLHDQGRTNRGEKEARPPHAILFLSFSLSRQRTMRVYEHVASSFSSVAPIPLLQARPHPCVVARLFNAALPLLSPWLRLATRGEEVFCFANQLILTKSPSSTFVGKKGKLTAGLTRIYRNTIYRLTRIRRYGNRIRGKPLRRNELIRRLAERTSSATFIESCVRTCHPIFLQAGSFPFDSRIDVL